MAWPEAAGSPARSRITSPQGEMANPSTRHFVVDDMTAAAAPSQEAEGARA